MKFTLLLFLACFAFATGSLAAQDAPRTLQVVTSDPDLLCFDARGDGDERSYLELDASGTRYNNLELGTNGRARIILTNGEWLPYYGTAIAGTGRPEADGPVGTYTITLADDCNGNMASTTNSYTFTVEPINFNRCPSDGTNPSTAVVIPQLRDIYVAPNTETAFCFDVDGASDMFIITGNDGMAATVQVRDENGDPIPGLSVDGNGTIDLSGVPDRSGLQIVVIGNDVPGAEITIEGVSETAQGNPQRFVADLSAGQSVIGANGCDGIGTLDELLADDVLATLTSTLEAGEQESICTDVNSALPDLIVNISDNDDNLLTLSFVGNDGTVISTINTASGFVTIPEGQFNGLQVVALVSGTAPAVETSRMVTINNFGGASSQAVITILAASPPPVTQFLVVSNSTATTCNPDGTTYTSNADGSVYTAPNGNTLEIGTGGDWFAVRNGLPAFRGPAGPDGPEGNYTGTGAATPAGCDQNSSFDVGPAPTPTPTADFVEVTGGTCTRAVGAIFQDRGNGMTFDYLDPAMGGAPNDDLFFEPDGLFGGYTLIDRLGNNGNTGTRNNDIARKSGTISGTYSTNGNVAPDNNFFQCAAGETIIVGPVQMALPVTLTAFTGTLAAKQIDLAWSTSEEVDNEGFEVQRSLDGANWTALGFVTAAGKNAGDYGFSDAEYAAGTNYYRLKQMDFDGAFEYSPVVVVDAGPSPDAVTLFPNPASAQLEVRFQGEEALNYRIFNVAGAEVATGVVNPVGRIDVSRLATGIYHLSVTNGGDVMTQRFSKR